MLEGEIDLEIMQKMEFSLDSNVLKERMLTVFTLFAEDTTGKEDINIADLSLHEISKNLKKESFDGNVAEAFEIYNLMHSLADSIPGAGDQFSKSAYSFAQWKAFDFIKSHTGRIEIVLDGNLQRVYFPIRPVCHYMSAGARKFLI